MSKKSIYVKHQDDIVRKIIDMMDTMPTRVYVVTGNDEAEKVSSWISEGYIKALKWVLGLDEKNEEVYVVKTNQRYRSALNEIVRTCTSLTVSSPDAEYFEDIFSTCMKALENKEDEDE
mgnify:CR=1 FL=1